MNILTDVFFKGAGASNPKRVYPKDKKDYIIDKCLMEEKYRNGANPAAVYYSYLNPLWCVMPEFFTAKLSSENKDAELESRIDDVFYEFAWGELHMRQKYDGIIYELYSDYDGESENANKEDEIEGLLKVTIYFGDKEEKFSLEMNVEKYKYFLETIYSAGIPVWLEKLREDKRLKEAGMDKMNIYELALCSSQNNIKVEDLGYFLSLDKYKLLEKVSSIKKEIADNSSNEMHAIRYKKEDSVEKSIVELISGTKSATLETAKYPLGEVYLFRMYQECDYGAYELTATYNPLLSFYSGFTIEVLFYGNEKYKDEMQYYYGDKAINNRLFCKIVSSIDRDFILESIKEEVLPRINIKMDESEFLDFLGIIYNEGIPSYLERIKKGKKKLILNNKKLW